MTALTVIAIPAAVSILCTITTTILLDRYYGFFHKNRIIKEIQKNRPIINCQVYKSTKPRELEGYSFFIRLAELNDQGKTGLYLERLSTSNNKQKAEKSYFTIKIINNTPHGATISAIYGVNNEILTIASGLDDIDIYPQKSITIYADATPQPITAIQLKYCNYDLFFPIEKSNSGFITPHIKNISHKERN